MLEKKALENYVNRLEDLENIANGFNGVTNTYAIQAGREIRVITESEKISDDDAVLLSRDIAHQIEENLTFSRPGESCCHPGNPGSGIYKKVNQQGINLA